MGDHLLRGKGEERSGGVMRIIGVLERRGGWSFQAKHVSDVENFLAEGITRWEEEYPKVSWQAQEFGVGKTEMCSEILPAATHSDELRS